MAVHIGSVGAINAVGLNVPQISAAQRANLTGFKAHKTFPSIVDGRPSVLARVADPGLGKTAIERMRSLATRAVAECLSFVTLPDQPLPILFALAEERINWGKEDALRFSQDLTNNLRPAACPDRSMVFCTGHAGGLAALTAAGQMITERHAEQVLVVGVETQHPQTLDIAENRGRLKRPENPNGLVPGEGSAAILLVNDAAAKAVPNQQRVQFVAGAEADEPDPWYTGKPILASGMTHVMQALLLNEDRFADCTFIDFTGETWRTEEWSVAYKRTPKKFGEPLDIYHPAGTWGDLGAAAGLFLTIAAMDKLIRPSHYQPKSALILCASDLTTHRAGALLQRVST